MILFYFLFKYIKIINSVIKNNKFSYIYMKQLLFCNNLNKKIIKNKVSILCTCYEKDYEEIKLLVHSINNINYSNFEFLLMIDDEFKKKYNEINNYFKNLKNLKNLKKNIFYSGENLGNYTHYNTLINYSDAKFIFITEPNTIWNKNLIQECVKIFNSKLNIDVINYKYNRYNCDNANNLEYYNTVFNNSNGWAWGDAMLVFRRTVFKEIGYFENAIVAADSDLWKRIKKLIPSKIYYLNINGFISIGAGESKKYIKEREDYWNSKILPRKKYYYLENNKLKLNFSFVENLAPVCPYYTETISEKKNILIIGHNWDFIDNIIDKLDNFKYNIDKHFFLKSLSFIKENDITCYKKLVNKCLRNKINDSKINYQDSKLFSLYENLCNKYDIVFCEWFELLVPVLSHIKNKKFKLIVRLHSYEYFYSPVKDSNFIDEIQNKALYLSLTNFNNIDKLIVVNDWFKQKISKNFQYNNILTIPNYYKTYDNHNLNINKRKKNIGLVGINPLIIKGLYDLLLIFKKLVEQDNEYKLYIKGSLDKRKEIPSYINKTVGEEYYINSIKLYDNLIKNYPDNIILCKHTNNGGGSMEDFYNKIGYLLTASIQESFHCVIMEAGSAGCIPILYENKDFKNIDIARTPTQYRFISFNEKIDIVNYIKNNERFQELSLSAFEYYNSMNTALGDFENLFDSYNFKEANWMIYYLYLCGTVPYTFYIKYSQKIDEFDYHKLEEVTESDLQKIIDTIRNTIYKDNDLEEVRKELIKNF